MKIVIDIPEDDYNAIRDNIKAYSLADMLFGAVQCGTALPQGHGRLVDGDLLDREMYHAAFETDTDFQKWDSGCWIRYKLYENIRNTVPTIIEGER